ncbi:MAG: HD domain-containing protein [Candidatus Kapabacteria bacterium]|jgi:guanosine-3',5'-bis(diphosphate) 3'-pyrophosphohydrolase|nr:HD domain-containing protein [Candidatus Kapabacteria bacterium]
MTMLPEPRYNRTMMSYEELEARLVASFSPLVVTKVLDAYEMSHSVHEYQRRNDGTPYFWHSTRVARILLDELNVRDGDLLIAGLLHDVLEDSDTITKSVLEYNFGAYPAFLVDILTKDLAKAKLDPEAVDLAHAQSLTTAPDDALVIKLVSRLDNFRCLEFNLKRNPLSYIQNTLDRYIPLCTIRKHPALAYLTTQLRLEANKILG